MAGDGLRHNRAILLSLALRVFFLVCCPDSFPRCFLCLQLLQPMSHCLGVARSVVPVPVHLHAVQPNPTHDKTQQGGTKQKGTRQIRGEEGARAETEGFVAKSQIKFGTEILPNLRLLGVLVFASDCCVWCMALCYAGLRCVCACDATCCSWFVVCAGAIGALSGACVTVCCVSIVGDIDRRYLAILLKGRWAREGGAVRLYRSEGGG